MPSVLFSGLEEAALRQEAVTPAQIAVDISRGRGVFFYANLNSGDEGEE
jgi:hypothetical protein